MAEYDVIIIGCGIVGAFAARELSKYELRVLVLEQAGDVGEGATKANSGILYPGFHPRGGSLKGISCVCGNQMYDTLCGKLGVPMQKIGALYVAFHPEGEEMLHEKYKKGLKNGALGMEVISGEEARRMEPHLSPRVTKAIYAPNTGIVSPFALILAVVRSAAENGAAFRFDVRVTGAEVEPDGMRLSTTQGDFFARYVINAAGGSAAMVESWLQPQDLVILPRRGQYYVFDRREHQPLRHVLYQAQETDEGGTLIAPTIDGKLIAGPTSEDVPSYRHVETTAAGLAHVERVVKKLLPEFDMGTAICNFAGVRANIKNLPKEQKDFFVRLTHDRMVSALGIKNPGMTAAPYLAQVIVSRLQEQGLALTEKDSFQDAQSCFQPFLQETPARQRALFERDPRYGKILCRCEGITEGDVVAALHGPFAARSLNGLKKRLHVGMGRCQGGFCMSRIVEVMCRETGCTPQQVLKGTAGSNLMKGWVKP